MNMKLKFTPSIIAVAISLLITYGLYSFHTGENKVLLSVGSFIFTIVTLILSIGFDFSLPRTSVNIKVVSGVFLAIGLIANITFTFFNFSKPTYIITIGILLLTYFLIVYSIYKSKQ